MTKEDQKAEACVLMKLMGIRSDICRNFENDGTVMLCVGGIFTPVGDELQHYILQFEEEYNATIFLVVHQSTRYGELFAMPFVGNYEEDWELVREDVTDGYVLTYCVNVTHPDCSEMGSICFRRTDNGGIIRTG